MDAPGRYHGWHMEALREWMESDLDIITVGTWSSEGMDGV